LFQREQGYATPKVDVRAAVFRNNEMLMVLEQEDGRWSLPGGWTDVGEPPSKVAEREILEESGYKARAVRLLAVYDRDLHKHPPLPFHVYKVFLQCDLLEENPKPNAECAKAAFFPEGKIPELSLTRVNEAEVARMFEFLHDPSLPADFD
jgi:ADP-ribose pyrophosphatase YjhB (NUDIX family)